MMDRDQDKALRKQTDEPLSPSAPAGEAQQLEPGDFYYEGPYMVFTEAYHLRRGYCCNSDCRHCPYR